MAGIPPGMLQQFMASQGRGGGGPPDETAMLPDTSEQVQVSSLALLKMLRHGRAGVPMEVMGLMLGEMVDDYTIKVVDVFAMPQTGELHSFRV
jgi:26S proteasome regulatory subunit N11